MPKVQKSFKPTFHLQKRMEFAHISQVEAKPKHKVTLNIQGDDSWYRSLWSKITCSAPNLLLVQRCCDQNVQLTADCDALWKGAKYFIVINTFIWPSDSLSGQTAFCKIHISWYVCRLCIRSVFLGLALDTCGLFSLSPLVVQHDVPEAVWQYARGHIVFLPLLILSSQILLLSYLFGDFCIHHIIRSHFRILFE